MKGIACYKKGEYEEAIAHYAEAIVHLKANTSTPKKDLCTVFHNRAAAHLKLVRESLLRVFANSIWLHLSRKITQVW